MPSESYLFAFEDILNDDSLSPAYRAKVLEMPSENYIAENRVLIEPALIREACDLIKRRIGQRLRGSFEDKIKTTRHRVFIDRMPRTQVAVRLSCCP